MAAQNRQVFVLMPFEDRFRDVYKTVIKKLSIEHINVNRADDLPFANIQIYDSVVAAIENADVVIADLSGNNPNVFYEMGYAHARGKIVIPISSSTRLPFDVAGFPTIFYELNNLKSLESPLKLRLSEALSSRQTNEQKISEKFRREFGVNLDVVERYALDKAEKANGSRPGMYFTEADVIRDTSVNRDIVYRILNALREMNRIICLNWKGESVWMASLVVKEQDRGVHPG